MRRFLTMSGTELAALIRAGRASSRDIVEAHIAQVEQVNPELNAVVAHRFDEARAEADAADAALARGEALPPFGGVPCTIKESFAVEGMPWTAGLVSRVGRPASSDAPTVRRLRAAGTIPLGVTNVSELCMWMESDNRVYGRSNNPYDPTRIVGGSSGGEGAIVGAGASPFGLGADIGGSIRMPAFFNGVFGHKPTPGVVPNAGQFPIAENQALRYLCTGPIVRRAEDLWPLLEILAGPAADGDGGSLGPGRPEDVDVSRLRVLHVEGDGRTAVSDDLLVAMERAAGHLADRGARVERMHIRKLRYALEIWAVLMHEAAQTRYVELMGGGRAVRPGLELVRWMTGRSPHTFPSIMLGLIEKVPAATGARARKAMEIGLALRRELAELLGDDGVLLYPPYAKPAPRHHAPLLTPLRWVYTAVMNVMELPVTQVPLGLNREGLPLGVQVVGGPLRDHVTIAVARELERAFGGWQMPRRRRGNGRH